MGWGGNSGPGNYFADRSVELTCCNSAALSKQGERNSVGIV